MNDLRLPALGAAAWTGGLVGMHRPAWVPATVAIAIAGTLGVTLWRRRAPGGAAGLLTAWAAVLLLCTVAWSAMIRGDAAEHGPVGRLASDAASVTVTLTLTSDPRPTRDRESVVVRAQVRELTARGRTWRTRADVVVLGDRSWQSVPLGAQVRTGGVLAPAERHTSGLLRARGSPELLEAPAWWWRGAARAREGIRTAVAPRDPAQRALVPSLVVGDDAGMDPGLVEDFATTGLTHLTAVSGTNLTLLVGALLIGARGLGVRGRGTLVVAALGIVGFILLARSEPSVVRAATMGTVALIGMGANGRQRGVRSLGAAVVVLLLWQPAMAVQVGFALSVLATAGILLLAPDWRDAMSAWLPRRVAEGIAIPAAAQLACTPVVAAISGEVSLAAVLANLLVAPAVAPVTVLGLAGGTVAVVWPWLGQLIAAPGAWAAGWIITVARRGAQLPTPALTWGTDALSLGVLVGLTLAAVPVAPRLLARRWTGVALVAAMIGGAFVPIPTPGWPPRDWVAVACDVGQGDALVLNAGPGEAVVVDVGPDPRAVDRCLQRLGIESVSLLVLTHPHADHTDGLAGVASGRDIAALEVSPAVDPVLTTREAAEAAREHALLPMTSRFLATRQVGEVTLQRVWPPPDGPLATGEEVNDASVVLLARVRGVTLLLTGDVEPPAQRGLRTLLAETRVDVLKLPHHGSRHQDLDFLQGLEARAFLVSAGEENTYGHPDPSLLASLDRGPGTIWRTDQHGDVAVVSRGGSWGVVPQR